MLGSNPLPQIDPAELMLASIGIREIISRKVEKIPMSQLRDMVLLPAKVLRLAHAVVHGEEIETTFGHDSYRPLLTDLAKGWDSEQAQKMLKALPPEYHVVASAVLVKSIQIIKQMDAEYPVNRYITVTGETKLAPSDATMFRFLSVLECIDRPTVIFELMSTGALLQSQVEAVRTVYPSFSKAVDLCLFDMLSRARAAKQSFQLPFRAERGIRAWFGKGPIPLEQMKRAQETAKMQAAKDQEKEAAREQDKQLNKAKMTQAQKADQAA